MYTGTHDNNPIQGWFATDATETEKKNIAAYLGREITADTVNDALIRLAMMSAARTVIIPVQDLLTLGGESRMNRPGVETGNWQWRVEKQSLDRDLAGRMENLARIYDRL
jgi:4-alpha-glucanotransferase